MTPSELLELANLVTGEPHEIIDGNVFMLTGWGQASPGKQFSPSLTGTAEQKAQALDVIVAAENSPECHQAYRNHVANGMSAFEASAKALIANGRKA